jgi:hypothetical protein
MLGDLLRLSTNQSRHWKRSAAEIDLDELRPIALWRMRISPGPGALTSTASAASTSGARRQAVEMVIHSGKTEAQVAAGTGLQRIQPHSLNICTSF